MKKEIARGAEAVLLRKNSILIKKRIKKSYRIPEIDEKLRKLRTRREAKIIEKISKIIRVPKIIKVDEEKKEIVMEFIEGEKLSDILDKLDMREQLSICKKIGENIAHLHEANIIHGDLTTSNIIYKDKEIYFIDFGLSFYSQRIEDKAVDLHLLKQALEAKHFKNWKILFKKILDGYKKYKNFNEVIERLKKVERRGRYKH